MGNRICRPRRSTVDDRFTRPQRLVREPSNVDYKKLRKLILSQKLAPCFDVVEDSNPDLEECPICFFYFPSLNRSKCCMKGICTECFLQMKPSNATPSAQCPFCKTPCYAVEYRGARTQEEKGLEQAEEQRVIEAKIRMQQRESQNGNQVILANQNSSPMEVQSPMSGSREQYNGEVQDFRGSELSLAREVIEFSGSPVNAWNERHQEFGLDLEEIMMMEAIWQSIRDSGLLKSTAQPSSGSTGEANRLNQSAPSLALVGQEELRSSDSVTVGIAVAIARLAEHNILRSEISQSIHGNEIIQTQNENYTEEHQGRMLGPTFHGADMLDEGPLRPAMNPEFDDMHSESGCLASCCSTTEDESWELQSAYSLNGSQCSSDGSICDEDPVAEGIDVESSCSSSIHTISDSSCGSPNCCDTGGSPGCPEFSGPITVDRQLRAFANSSA